MRVNPAALSIYDPRMNKTERKYADRLQVLLFSGKISKWRFEAFKMRMADNTWYTPDFWVVTPDEKVEIHEVKGFWREDAWLKFKTCSGDWREFDKWVIAKLKKGTWELEVYR